jgi:hypothetical protein
MTDFRDNFHDMARNCAILHAHCILAMRILPPAVKKEYGIAQMVKACLPLLEGVLDRFYVKSFGMPTISWAFEVAFSRAVGDARGTLSWMFFQLIRPYVAVLPAELEKLGLWWGAHAEAASHRAELVRLANELLTAKAAGAEGAPDVVDADVDCGYYWYK